MSTSSGHGDLEQVGGLLRRMPDPERDREALLVLGEPDGDLCRDLATELFRRGDWRSRPLGVLLPGLSLLPAPLLWERLTARATNCLTRAGIDGTLALARKTPTGVTLLPEVGAKTSKEIAQAALGAWATAHVEPVDVVATAGKRLQAGAEPAAGGLPEKLRTDPVLCSTPLGELLPGLDLLEVGALLDRLGARAMNCLGRGGVNNVQALAALTPSEIGALQNAGATTVDKILTVAMREWATSQLAEPGPSPQAEPERPDLAAAFEELEAKPGFVAFRRRRLEAGPRPTCRQLATEFGITYQGVQQREAAIEAWLMKSMRCADSPIRIAVEELRSRLGAVARPGELERAVAGLDRNRRTLELGPDHRRALLIHLAEYRTGPEWVLGPDIESLTDVVLATHARSGAGAFDAVGRHLTALGVREELQLPWIVSRHGFRIIDGELRSAAVI